MSMSNLIVDTGKLNKYADRISSVNSRINQLDYRLNSLYWQVGLLDLFKLIQADALTGYSWRLYRCQNYLIQTASDFNQVEQELDYDRFIEKVNALPNYSNGKVSFDNVAGFMEWLGGEWIDQDDTFGKLPMWMRESLKETIKELADELIVDSFSDYWEAAQNLFEGEYIEALKEIAGAIYEDDNFFKNLAPQFYVNSVFGMVEEYIEYAQDPSLINLLSIGWSGTVGSALETGGEAAWDIVKLIPGISDWYDERGVEDAGGAFNAIYTEGVRLIFGDDMADYCGSYYAENGGLFNGLVNGFGEIADYIGDACEDAGGIVGLWKSGWNSIFA